MATNDTTPTPAEDGTAASTPAPAPAAPTAAPRRGAGRALAITGIAVGSVLTLGLTFAGGVALGQVLPGGPGDRGPISGEAGAMPGGPGDRGERIGERVEQRMDERMEQRQEQRDELRAQFEQWLQDQGIDPSELPAPPAP